MFSFIYDKVLHKGACISKIHAHTANTPLTSSMSVQKGKKKASLALFSYNSVAKKKIQTQHIPIITHFNLERNRKLLHSNERGATCCDSQIC